MRSARRSAGLGWLAVFALLVLLVHLARSTPTTPSNVGTRDARHPVDDAAEAAQEVKQALQEDVAISTEPARGRTQAQEAEALVKRAQRLLSHVEHHSAAAAPRTHLHPTASLFSLSSYTPGLDTWARSSRSRLLRFLASRIQSFLSPPSSDRERPKLHMVAFRLFSNLLRTVFRLFKRRIGGGSGAKTLGQPEAAEATQRAAELLQHAVTEYGHLDAMLALAGLHLWGGRVPGTLARNVTKATELYSLAAEVHGSAEAQSALAFLLASGYGDGLESSDQAGALLYGTFAALGGDYGAELMIGYRHWAGIATKQSCSDALPFYKSAADKAMRTFHSGPPGGMHLTPAKVRLADRDGGVYGAGASVVSAGAAGRAAAAHHNPGSAQEWEDVLEYYQFHAERGDAAFMFRLGRIYYQGFGTAADHAPSTYATSGGRDFPRALRWFNRLARAMWPKDPQAPAPSKKGGVAASPAAWQYDAAQDVKLKVEEQAAIAAGLAAGYLGKMYLRGEGVPANNAKAFLWLNRGVSQGDRESHNGLGIMYRDGLGVPQDLNKAVTLFQAAATHDLADASVNLGKFYLGINDRVNAAQSFEAGIKHGDSFQAYYYLAELNTLQPNRPDLCPIAVAFYKRVAERGDWGQEVFWKAEKAWADGDEETALLGFWIMAERGYEVAQNNVAYILDRDKRRLALPKEIYASNATDRLALAHWTRSAAQDNIDALVKMGDYYLSGMGSLSGEPQADKAAACYQTASNMHVSAMAMWNLGWMHENGIGVSKDFHLAKRYYDLAMETNLEASLPATLSLLKLYVRTLWGAVVHGDTKALSIFTSPGDDFAEASWWNLRKLREEFARRWFGVGQPLSAVDTGPAVTGGAAAAPGTETGADQRHPRTEAEGVASHRDAVQRALQQEDDPVEWARNARERERVAGEGEEEDDFFDFEGEPGDDFMETAGILLLCLGAGVFVFFRQQREQAQARAEANRQAGRQGAAVHPPSPAPAAIPNAGSAPTPTATRSPAADQAGPSRLADPPSPFGVEPADPAAAVGGGPQRSEDDQSEDRTS